MIDVFGRPFVKRFALCYRTVVCPVLSVCPVCDIGYLWPNGWMDQNEISRAGRPWPWPHCVRWEPSSPHQRDTAPPQFSAHVYCGHGRPSQLLLSSCNTWALPCVLVPWPVFVIYKNSRGSMLKYNYFEEL